MICALRRLSGRYKVTWSKWMQNLSERDSTAPKAQQDPQCPCIFTWSNHSTARWNITGTNHPLNFSLDCSPDLYMFQQLTRSQGDSSARMCIKASAGQNRCKNDRERGGGSVWFGLGCDTDRVSGRWYCTETKQSWRRTLWAAFASEIPGAPSLQNREGGSPAGA